MKSVYSPLEKAIYPAFMYEDYVKAGTWPSDGIEISDDDAIAFNGSNQPRGKILGMVEGVLSWVDLPAPTQEQIIIEATNTKQRLMENASNIISPLQDSVDLDMATDVETASLKEWKIYRVLLNRIDPNDTSNIVWPEIPK